MDYLHQIIKTVEPIQYVYGLVAIIGGVARYLNSYAMGQTHFSGGVFVASAFVAGFSGWMFAIMGTSMHLPQEMVFIMAGTGGFFGDQTMKLIMEWIQGKIKKQ